MATLQEIEAALRKADAAGNADDARRLAAAYREMQAAGPVAEKPQVPNPMGLGMGQGFTLGFGDEIYAAGTAPIRAIGGLVQGEGYDLGKAYNEGLQSIREVHGIAQEQDPVAYGVGEVAGNLSLGGAAAKGGLTLMQGAKPTVASMGGRGAAEGAIYGGISGAGNADGDLMDRARAAVGGAALGAAAGGAIGGVSGSIAARGAAKAVPSVEALKAEAGKLYDIAEASGVTFPKATIKTLADDIAAKAMSEGIDPTLHPRATAALKRLQEAANTGMTVKEAQTMRRILSGAGKDPTNPDEGRIATLMRDAFDDVVERGAPELGTARGLYARAKKGEVIEEAIQKAYDAVGANYSAAGLETALRQQFRALLNNKRAIRGFSDGEVAAIRKVVKGGAIENLARFIGKAAPTGVVSFAGAGGVPFMMGNAIGGPAVGAAAAGTTMGAGIAGRSLASNIAVGNARAASALARGGPNALGVVPSSLNNLVVLRPAIAAGGAQAAELPNHLMRLATPHRAQSLR